MGDLDQFAKQTFAEETSVVTRGAVSWQLPPELGLSDVRLDGLLLVNTREALADLPSPWKEADPHAEIVVELKMQGDHLDSVTLQRSLLRRQARQVRLTETAAPAHQPEVPLWIVASHMPALLRRVRQVVRLAPGVYDILPAPFSFLWIAANELQLHEALIPFLVARTGAALDKFGLWVKSRRPPDWLSRMLQFLPMSMPVQEEVLRYMGFLATDPEVRERQRRVIRLLVNSAPEVRNEVLEEGREEGLQPLVHQFERRLGRPLTAGEHGILRDRLGRLGANRLGDVVLDLSAEALGAWLTDADAT